LSAQAAIGIALAAYKPEPNFLYQQLQSIAFQTWTNWVCYISFDSPLAEIQNNNRFKEFFDDKRFVWSENEKPLGHRLNFEKAMNAVAGLGVEAIACCDQDDVWFPFKLAISFANYKKIKVLWRFVTCG